MDAAAELEEEQRVRLDEIHFLQNICVDLATNDQKDRMRRSLVIMLYSHFEGFAKFAFEVYLRAIENSKLKCCEVQPALATFALKDLFKAIRSPEQGTKFLPIAIRSMKELKPLAVERAFIEKAFEFGERLVSIPSDFIDLESNLKPIVLQKNLYRLGLPHDLFEKLEGSVHKLLNYRNNIAHGSFVNGIEEVVYIELYEAVIQVMNELKKTIVNAIATEAFRRS
jgi:hypothetical protein